MSGTRRRRVGTAVALSGLGALAMSFVAPAFACTGISTVSVAPVVAAPGADLEVSAQFSGDAVEPVQLWWVGEGGRDRQMLTTVTPDAEGKVRTVVKAPATAAVGSYLVKVREVGGAEDTQANALVKIVDSPLQSSARATAGPGGMRPLSSAPAGFGSTGGASGTSVVVLALLGGMAVVLVGAGGAVVVRNARRS